MKFYLGSAALLLSACAADAQDVPPDVSGIWVNERGAAVSFTEEPPARENQK